MTDKQEDKLGMLFSVVAACDKHEAAWSGLPAFAAFAAADDVLKNRLDKLVPILALSHAAFATDWWNSRNIYDSGGGPQTSYDSSEDESSSEESESSESNTSSEWTSSSISEESSWEESSSVWSSSSNWESSSESWESSSSGV